MTLSDEFRHAGRLGLSTSVDNPVDDTVEKFKPIRRGFGKPRGPRRVRTLAGVKVFGQPIGTIITRDMIERARREGKLKPGSRYAAPEKRGYDVPKGPTRPRTAPKAPAARQAPSPKPKTPAKAPAAAKKPTKQAMTERSAQFRARMKRPMIAEAREVLREDIENDDILTPARKQALLAELPAATKRPATKKATVTAQRAKDRAEQKAQAAKKPAPKAPEDDGDDPLTPDEFYNLISEAMDTADSPEKLNFIVDFLSDDADLPVGERNRLLRRAGKRMFALTGGPADKALAPKKDDVDFGDLPDEPEPPKKDSMQQQRDFMRLRDEVNRFKNEAYDDISMGRKPDAAEARRLLDAVEAAGLEGGMRQQLVDDIDEAVNPKKRRSARYDTLAEQVDEATTKSELARALKAVMNDPDLDANEKISLSQQIALQANDWGVDPKTLLSVGATVPEDYETHQDKVKPKVGPALPAKFQKHLLAGRPDVRDMAPFDRAQFVREHADVIAERQAWQDKPDETPAGKEILSGKRVDQVKNTEGMMEFLRAHPERFDIIETAGGQGGAMQVFDLDDPTGVYFFKETNAGTRIGSQGLDAKFFGEAVNEVVSSKLGGKFRQWFPDTDFVDLRADRNPTIRMDHLEIHADNQWGDSVDFITYNADARWERNAGGEFMLKPGAPKVRDRKNPLALHISSFLFNESDRHQGNIAVVHHKDGSVDLVGIDNGAAFHGFDSVTNDAGEIPDHLVDSPESIGYAEWIHTYTQDEDGYHFGARGHFIARETVRAYNDADAMDIDVLERDAADILKGFASMNVDQIKAELLRRFPNMPDYERAHLESAARIFKARLTAITPADVARFLVEYDDRERGGM